MPIRKLETPVQGTLEIYKTPDPVPFVMGKNVYEMCVLTRGDFSAFSSEVDTVVTELTKAIGSGEFTDKTGLEMFKSFLFDHNFYSVLEGFVLRGVDKEDLEAATMPQIIRAAELFYEINFTNLPPSTRTAGIRLIQLIGSTSGLLNPDSDESANVESPQKA